jgi:chemotaxis protein MotA
MDSLTLLGLCIGVFAVASGQLIDGGDLTVLLNIPAIVIVFGGTLGAVMVQTPIKTFKHAFKILPWIFLPPYIQDEELKKTVVTWCRKSRRLGILSLEKDIEKTDNPLAKHGLSLVVSGIDKDTIRKILELQVDNKEVVNSQAAKVFESMGGYSPTIGIMGAVLGLIQVMRNLTDPSELGLGIAVAFVATIYGVGLANLIFLPVANKLKYCLYKQLRSDEMLIEGIVAVANGESPNMVDLKMNSYLQCDIRGINA